MGSRQIYTPQIVIDGQFQAVGSKRHAVEKALQAARTENHVVLAAEASPAGGWRIHVPAAAGWTGEAKLLLCRYDKLHQVTIERGENHGHTLNYLNVARSWSDFGRWKGQAASYDLPAPGDIDWNREGIVVMLQALNGPGVGPILGAVKISPLIC